MSKSVYVCVCVCVCLSVCLSVREHIFGATYAIFTKFLCMLLMAVVRSSSGRMTKFQEELAVLGFCSPLTMHCNAFAAKWIIPHRPGRGDGSSCRMIRDCLVYIGVRGGCLSSSQPAVLGVYEVAWSVCLSDGLSVCHDREPRKNG